MGNRGGQRCLPPLPTGERSDYGADNGEIKIAQTREKRTVAKRTGKRTPIHFGKLAFKPENKSKYKHRKLRMPALVL